MFDFKGFIKKGLMDAVGKMTDYEVMFIAAYWFDKHVLSKADMTDIMTAIKATAITEDGNDRYEMPIDVTYDYGLSEPPDEAFF